MIKIQWKNKPAQYDTFISQIWFGSKYKTICYRDAFDGRAVEVELNDVVGIYDPETGARQKD